MNILVTGGAGYIGSHMVEKLKKSGYTPIVFDNLSTGHKAAVPIDVKFVEGDIHDVNFLSKTMIDNYIQGIIHFAASSLVGESMTDPAKYYVNNVEGTLHLLLAMLKAKVNKLVFSSTAAVYGEPSSTPIKEDFPLHPTNVYGRTKLVIENMLQDFDNAYDLKYVALRYFNAAGASTTSEIGEDHNPETHLIPLVLKTAQGVRKQVAIYGTDYSTNDGTCIRDYIHVCDLASAHILALQRLLTGGESTVYNLGSENGFSVRDIINTAKQITNKEFMVVEEARRAGDPAVLVASSAKIHEELGWKVEQSTTKEIIASAWQWHQNHPFGYGEK